ncbi:LppU/SCO3897 family protein [Actinokineospora sp. HUAS TT18]|uniref:LppU/SCO3897 family protein n=1 Tax=Actinokineospora sp. HUAS TT18 TaxID=3447451 RepID=UPI003F528ABF
MAPGGNGKTAKVAVGLVLLVAVGLSVFFSVKRSPAAADAGDCVSFTVVERGTAVNAVDCADPAAVFKVAKRLDSIQDDCGSASDYAEYEWSAGGDGYSLCLMVNGRVGDCFAALDLIDIARRVPCDQADFEVLQVLDGATDMSLCPPFGGVVDGFLYTEPPTVICGKRN